MTDDRAVGNQRCEREPGVNRFEYQGRDWHSGDNAGGPGDDQLFTGQGNDVFADTQGNNANVSGGPAGRTAGMTDFENQVFALINQQRQANGLAPLAANAQLQFAASVHSTNMATASNVIGLAPAMNHTLAGSPEPTLVSRGDYSGYNYQ